MLYLAWALLLVAQNAAFTWVSRARNSGSDWYHGFAAIFSNGIWFAATFITFERVWTVLKTGDVALGIMIGLVYVVATVTGSVSMGMFLRKFVEKGKRKVGHYEEQAGQIQGMQRAILEMGTWQRRLIDRYLEETTGVEEPTMQGAWKREQARLRASPADEEAVVRANAEYEQIERKVVLLGDEIAQIIAWQRRFMDEYSVTPSGDLIRE